MEHLSSLPVEKDVAGQHTQNPSWRFCVVFGDVAPLHEQDVLHRGMQLPMECTCISSDKLTGTRTLPKSRKWVFPAARRVFSYHEEPWPGTLLGEITECNFTATSPAQQGAGPITVFTAGLPQQMMMLGKWGLPERAPKKTHQTKNTKKPHTTTKQNWFMYSLSPLSPSSCCILLLSSPCHGKPHLCRQELFSHISSAGLCSPTETTAANRRTHRHSEINTSTVLSSSLVLKECDSCHSPFPVKAKEGFSRPTLLDPTAKPGFDSRMSSSHEKLPGKGMGGAGSRPTAPQSQWSLWFPIPRNLLAIPAERQTESPYRERAGTCWYQTSTL